MACVLCSLSFSFSLSSFRCFVFAFGGGFIFALSSFDAPPNRLTPPFLSSPLPTTTAGCHARANANHEARRPPLPLFPNEGASLVSFCFRRFFLFSVERESAAAAAVARVQR
jgi:hypothetical protein